MCTSCLGRNQSQEAHTKAHRPLCVPAALEATTHRKHTHTSTQPPVCTSCLGGNHSHKAHNPLCVPAALEATTHRKHTQAHSPLCVQAALEATNHRKQTYTSTHTAPSVYQLHWRQPLTGSSQPPVCTSCLGGNHSQESHTQAHIPLCVPAALEATTHRKHTTPCVYQLPWRQPITRSTHTST